ncbi:MAG: outer membrane beta-barrel protein [Desulfobacterales bacterium]|nr:outer membrane beta-barrel protein [Desulfobacterales bacterium]
MLVFVFGISISGSVMADGGVYGGIGFGSSSVDIESGALDDGSNISGESKDETDTSLSFFIGYEVNDNLSVEGGYIDFGEASVTGISDGTGSFWFEGPVEIKYETTAIFLDIIGKYEINNSLDLIGKAGFYHADVDADATDVWGTVSIDESNTGLLLGFGLSYGFTDKVSGRLDGQGSVMSVIIIQLVSRILILLD